MAVVKPEARCAHLNKTMLAHGNTTFTKGIQSIFNFLKWGASRGGGGWREEGGIGALWPICLKIWKHLPILPNCLCGHCLLSAQFCPAMQYQNNNNIYNYTPKYTWKNKNTETCMHAHKQIKFCRNTTHSKWRDKSKLRKRPGLSNWNQTQPWKMRKANNNYEESK